MNPPTSGSLAPPDGPQAPARRLLTSGPVMAAVLVAGSVLLFARPALLAPGRDPTGRLVVLFVVLGLVGALWPLTGRQRDPAAVPGRRAAVALAVGAVAFTVGRFATGGPVAAHPLLFRLLVLNALAAVAEEAFFRRMLYGALLPRGQAVAIVGSAVAFAAVHAWVWGLWVLPLDLAAGLLLSWQRAASGRWSVPAATHVFANSLALV